MRRLFGDWLLPLIAGLALGLAYAWIVSPARVVDSVPSALRADFKDDYRAAIAAAYASSGDLPRAQARLALIGDPDPVQALSAQAQRMLGAGEPFETVQQVAQLASALQGGPPASTAPVAVSASATVTTAPPDVTGTEPTATSIPQSTRTPLVINTPTPRPTHTPTATLGAPFVLVEQESLCDAALPEGLLQITVLDARRRQLPGVEIVVTWEGGEEHFFTGLKPDLGNGYADFQMAASTVYALQLASGGSPLTDLSAPVCSGEGGAAFLGSLSLTFQQP
ncbi:MAG: hypothetical protein ACOYZ8_01020 [Chloroflexota bacterium]